MSRPRTQADNLSRLRLDKYLAEYKYLQSELAYVSLQFDEFNARFMQDFKQDIASTVTRPPDDLQTTSVDNVDDNSSRCKCTETFSLGETVGPETALSLSEEKDLSSFFSRLYKKLLLLCHPDKDPDQAAVFEELQQAHVTQDYLKMLLMARRLNVEVLTDLLFTCDFMKVVNKIVDALHSKINDYKNSFAWVWCQECSPDERERLRTKLSASIRKV